MEIFKNESISLIEEDKKLFIFSEQPGFDIKEFNNIITKNPTISISNFSNLKISLLEASGQKVFIGYIKPRIEVLISGNEMEARVKLNITAEEFADNPKKIYSETVSALHSMGITEGIDPQLGDNLIIQKEIVAAKGVIAIDGQDAKISYFQLSEKRPLVKDDGKVNMYDMQLINNIKVGDWLGEKMPPSHGKPGKTVTGKVITPKTGMDLNLKYDRKTIAEYAEDNVVVLRALVNGAVKYDMGRITVDDHLVIPGDVCFETGNIDFNGHVTIEGTVKDGFSVAADGDIAILNVLGIGMAESIVSRKGSIFIKGGIYGKNISSISANKNVYVKYCNETTITAGEDINIGFYSLDSNLTAKTISLDPIYGKIIGGTITAQIQVTAGTIGSKSEKKTTISINGFDRQEITRTFDNLLISFKDLLQRASKIKSQIETWEYYMSGAEYANMDEYNQFQPLCSFNL